MFCSGGDVFGMNVCVWVIVWMVCVNGYEVVGI